MSIFSGTYAYIKAQLSMPPIARVVLDILPEKWSLFLVQKFNE
jgi:hypothetical protein